MQFIIVESLINQLRLRYYKGFSFQVVEGHFIDYFYLSSLNARCSTIQAVPIRGFQTFINFIQ